MNVVAAKLLMKPLAHKKVSLGASIELFQVTGTYAGFTAAIRLNKKFRLNRTWWFKREQQAQAVFNTWAESGRQPADLAKHGQPWPKRANAPVMM
jgi:hypothetical protein